MSNELESQVSEVSTESPSETPSAPEKSSQSPAPQESKTAEKYVPYERFQEIIQQKNEFVKRLEEHEARYKALEDRFNKPKAEPVEDKLVARLKGIDPEFAERFEKLNGSLAELESLKQWKAQADQERIRSDAQNELNRLHSEYKVSKDEQDYVKDLVQLRVQRLEAGGRSLSVKDLAGVYKDVVETQNKMYEVRKRTTIANYAAEKKSTTTPALKKGDAPKPAQKPMKYSTDREEAKAQIIKQTMERVRAAKQSAL